MQFMHPPYAKTAFVHCTRQAYIDNQRVDAQHWLRATPFRSILFEEANQCFEWFEARRKRTGFHASEDGYCGKQRETKGAVMINILREAAYGLKLGFRYSVTNRHGMMEQAFRPNPRAARANGYVGMEEAGR
jgi:hypothetical protein